MKKVLLLLFFFFIFNVNASIRVDEEIKLEKVNLEVEEEVSFKQILEINYELLPIDVDNKKLEWKIINRNTDLVVKMEKNTTELQKGVFLLDIENKSEESLSFKVEVLQNREVFNSIDILVENKEETEERLFLSDLDNLKNLIEKLEIDINRNNIIENKELLEKIDSLINYELQNELSEDELEKINDVNSNIDEYELKVENNKKIVIIIALSVLFFGVLTLMFRKEKK